MTLWHKICSWHKKATSTDWKGTRRMRTALKGTRRSAIWRKQLRAAFYETTMYVQQCQGNKYRMWLQAALLCAFCQQINPFINQMGLEALWKMDDYKKLVMLIIRFSNRHFQQNLVYEQLFGCIWFSDQIKGDLENGRKKKYKILFTPRKVSCLSRSGKYMCFWSNYIACLATVLSCFLD